MMHEMVSHRDRTGRLVSPEYNEYEEYKKQVFDRLPPDVKREFAGPYKADVEEAFDEMVSLEFLQLPRNCDIMMAGIRGNMTDEEWNAYVDEK